jgi:peptidoglycan/LPS O-acetylase OafA/YrhL
MTEASGGMRLGEGLAAAFALRRRAFDWRQRLLFLGLAAAVIGGFALWTLASPLLDSKAGPWGPVLVAVAAPAYILAALVARLAPGARARSADAARWAGS